MQTSLFPIWAGTLQRSLTVTVERFWASQNIIISSTLTALNTTQTCTLRQQSGLIRLHSTVKRYLSLLFAKATCLALSSIRRNLVLQDSSCLIPGSETLKR